MKWNGKNWKGRCLSILALACLLASASPQVAASPLDEGTLPPLQVPVSNPTLLPPVEMEGAAQWALVVFYDARPVTLKALDAASYAADGLPRPEDAVEKARDAASDTVEGAGAIQVESGSVTDKVAREAEQSLFDLHVADWPGGLAAQALSLLVQHDSLPQPKRFTVDVHEFTEDGVVFEGVPVLVGAKYLLHVDSTPYELALFREQVAVGDVESSLAVGAGSCGYPATFTTKGWDDYGRDWEDTTSEGWKALSHGAWKYHWTYEDTCGYYGKKDVRAGFAFGWSGQNKLYQNGLHNVVFGAQWWGSKDVECHRSGGYGHQVCEGHRFTLGNVHFHYRTPQAPGAQHKDAIYSGYPSSSCTELMPPGGAEALTTAAFIYPWVGVAGYVPDSVCKTQWAETSRGPDGTAGLGARLKEEGVSDGELKQAVGYIATSYPQATPSQFRMELVARVAYNAWMNACAGPCRSETAEGGHYYVTEPVARVVPNPA